MFNIDYIKVFEGTHERIRKNLKVNYEYRFHEVLDSEFFARNISVHAIVGKNGSGKSTLLEIMARLANNLSYLLLKDIPREAADNLCYVFGLYAEMGWHEGGKKGVLRCEDAHLTFKCGDFSINKTIDERAGLTIYRAEHKFEEEYAEVRKMAGDFFYTLIMNYSLQSFVAQDYIGEESKSKSSNRHQTWDVKEVWVNALFHKNDGYMCPININPYRDCGTIDMNKEMKLTRSRVAALLQYFKAKGRHLIEGYQLKDIIYTFHPEILKGYFNSDDILSRYNALIPPADKKEEDDREKNKDENGRKVGWIIALFNEVLKSETDNVTKAIMRVFGVNSKAYNQKSYVAGMLYLVCKVLNIGHTYPKYILLVQDKAKYEIINALDTSNEASVIETVEELARKVKEENSHVALKVHRTEMFLFHYANIKKNAPYGLEIFNDNLGLTAKDYLNAFDKRADSLDVLEILTPPSIYQQHVYLQKENERGVADGEPIELSLLSSGERQFVFSISSIIYHLTNLLSVEESLPKYHCFNLVIDEVEICFHPEYQRTFLRNLLSLLERLEFNVGDKYINILLTTHSPFLLSDIPECHVLYMTDKEELPTGRTFGANIYDLLNQQFFMNNTIGEFAAQKINEVVKVYRMDTKSEDRARLFRDGFERMTQLIGWIGDTYLRKVVMQMVTEMSEQYGLVIPLEDEEIDRQIREHKDAIHKLEQRKKRRYD